MELVIDELRKSQRYHQRQLEENSQKIQAKKEAIELLQTANLKHVEILLQLDKAIKELEKGLCDQTETSGKIFNIGSITEEDVI